MDSFFVWFSMGKPTVNTPDKMNGLYCGGFDWWWVVVIDCPLDEQGGKKVNSRSVYTLFAFQLELAHRTEWCVCIVKNVHVSLFHPLPSWAELGLPWNDSPKGSHFDGCWTHCFAGVVKHWQLHVDINALTVPFAFHWLHRAAWRGWKKKPPKTLFGYLVGVSQFPREKAQFGGRLISFWVRKTIATSHVKGLNSFTVSKSIGQQTVQALAINMQIVFK